jgi:hypothetical protein
MHSGVSPSSHQCHPDSRTRSRRAWASINHAAKLPNEVQLNGPQIQLDAIQPISGFLPLSASFPLALFLPSMSGVSHQNELCRGWKGFTVLLFGFPQREPGLVQPSRGAVVPPALRGRWLRSEPNRHPRQKQRTPLKEDIRCTVLSHAVLLTIVPALAKPNVEFSGNPF